MWAIILGLTDATHRDLLGGHGHELQFEKASPMRSAVAAVMSV